MRDVKDIANQRRKLARFKVRFPDLHDVNAAPDGSFELCDQQRARFRRRASERPRQPVAVSDEAKKPFRRHGCVDG
jgi:hypothetical protein